MTGIIILDKHEDISSFWAVAQLRRISGEKKAGHTGTLDPMASGVLPVMLGGATKFCDFLPSHDKSYRATLMLGATTDTLDITGRVTSQRYVDVTADDFRSALRHFTGKISQLPPMYSAVFKNGVRLYQLARQGIEVEREAREIDIYSSELVGYNEKKGEYIIDVCCSAGTYIRTLASDIGEMLGCGAVLTSLRRTSANGFSEGEAKTVAELENFVNSGGDISSLLIPVDVALSPYPSIHISPNQSVRFGNGGALDTDRLNKKLPDGLCRVYSPENVFLGLGEIKNDSREMAVKKLLTR